MKEKNTKKAEKSYSNLSSAEFTGKSICALKKILVCCCTHHEEVAEVSQVSKEVLDANSVGVEGEVASQALVELLHILVHGGKLLVLLSGMLGKAVGTKWLRKDKQS